MFFWLIPPPLLGHFFFEGSPFYVLTSGPCHLSSSFSKDVWFLSPGIGAQGGALAKALKVGLRADGLGILLPISRGWGVGEVGDRVPGVGIFFGDFGVGFTWRIIPFK